MGSYAVPKLVGGTNALMLGNVISQHLTVTRNWPLASAISGALIIITSIVVWLFTRYENKLAGGAESGKLIEETSKFFFILTMLFFYIPLFILILYSLMKELVSNGQAFLWSGIENYLRVQKIFGRHLDLVF